MLPKRRIITWSPLWFAASAGAALGAVALGTGVLVEDYGPVTLPFLINGNPLTTSGLHDSMEPYAPINLQCQTDLDVDPAMELANMPFSVFTVLESSYPAAAGWNYTTAANKLSAGALKVKTYDAQGTLGRVGAEFHVEYAPGPGDPVDVHWIQVISNNHKHPGQHGTPDNKVDVKAGQANPYYDHFGAATATLFYDFPGRVDPTNNHDWVAYLFLADGPAIGAGPGNIRIYEPGIEWGWENFCGPAPSVPPSLFHCEPNPLGPPWQGPPGIGPGTVATFDAQPGSSMFLEKGPMGANVSLQSMQVTMNIENTTSAGGITDYTFTSGSGQFAPYTWGGQPILASNITLLSGGGSIHWEAGEISANMQVLVTSPGWTPIRAEAQGTGTIDPQSGTVTIDPSSMAIELEGAPIPAMSPAALGALSVLMLLVGIWFHRRQRTLRAA